MPRRSARTAKAVGIVVSLLVSVAPTLSASPASATSNGSWSVFPTVTQGQAARPMFQPYLTPGVEYRDSVTIANQSPTTQTFNLYAADAFNTTAGAFSLRRRTDPKLDMGSWIHLPISSFVLPPLRAEIVPFTIDPPITASPGYHDGGIVAESTSGRVSKDGAVDVTVLQAVGVRVYGRIRGPLKPGLSVGALSIESGGSLARQFGAGVSGAVKLTVVNTGNTNVTPKALLSISPLVGRSRDLPKIEVPQLLPRGSATFIVPYPKVIPYGHLSANLRLSAPGVNASGSSGAFVIPWLLVLVILGLVALYIAFKRRRRKRDPVSAADFFSPPKHAKRDSHAVKV
jgi:hypothetical protein